MLYDYSVGYVLWQWDAILVVLLAGEYLVWLAIEQAYECHPLLLVVLETYHVGFKYGGAHLGDEWFHLLALFLLLLAVG